jgi:hypothetical protein
MRTAQSPDKLVASWCGPEGAAVDFLFDGVGLEVKASRRQHCHHVSQSQAGSPVGTKDAFTLSFWLNQDPVGGRSLVELVEELSDRVTDKPEFYKKLAAVGFSLADHDTYRANRYLMLEPPLVFETAGIPRVPQLDPAISEVRYVVTLDSADALTGKEASRLLGRLGIKLLDESEGRERGS